MYIHIIKDGSSIYLRILLWQKNQMLGAACRPLEMCKPSPWFWALSKVALYFWSLPNCHMRAVRQDRPSLEAFPPIALLHSYECMNVSSLQRLTASGVIAAFRLIRGLYMSISAGILYGTTDCKVTVWLELWSRELQLLE